MKTTPDETHSCGTTPAGESTNGDLDQSEVEFASRVLEDALALLSETGHPFDLDTNIRMNRKLHWREFHRPGEFPSLSPLFKNTLFGEEFRFAAGELIGKHRMRKDNALAGGYVAPAGTHVIPIYRQPHGSPECFILADVGDLAGSRLYPLECPRDVIFLSISFLGAPAERIGFLCELTSIYCDAVRLAGEGVGFRRTLITSLGNLVGALGTTLRPDSDSEPTDTSRPSDDCE